jgi:DNA-binding transcriptional LysR family regulator
MVFNDLGTKLAACTAGHGIALSIEFGLDSYFASGALVQVLPEWAEERYPLYAYSRHQPPAKVRAFLDFLLGSIAPPTSARKARAGGKRSVTTRAWP